MKKVVQFLSSLKLASVLLLLLMVLTWLGTLEQVDHGLHKTIHKYFTWRNVVVFPDITINGKLVPLPLPGAYWVSLVLFFNMFLGGIVKIRKGWKYAGVILSHFGILLLLLGGFVTHHFSQRGNMALYEGESSDYAQSYHDHTIEISQLSKQGIPQRVHLISREIMNHVERVGASPVSVSFESLPFQFEISHYLKNCRPREVGPVAAGDTPTVDGYSLFKTPIDNADEANLNGCLVRVSDGTEFLLFSGAFTPFVFEYEGIKYAVSLRKSLWKMPFLLTLNDFNAEFFPSGKPKKFESYVTRTQEGLREKVKIYMNHPMRYLGYTFFQASWGPQQGPPGRTFFSVFEVVKNPADQWPFYSILVTSVGLFFHFGMMLWRYIGKQTQRSKGV